MTNWPISFNDLKRGNSPSSKGPGMPPPSGVSQMQPPSMEIPKVEPSQSPAQKQATMTQETRKPAHEMTRPLTPPSAPTARMEEDAPIAKEITRGPKQPFYKNMYSYLAIFLAFIILFPAVYSFTGNVFILVKAFFNGSIGFKDLVHLFTGLAAFLAVIILLTTPFGKLRSPLQYFIKQIGKSWDDLRLATEQKADRQPHLVSILFFFICLFVLLATYFFLIKNLVIFSGGEIVGNSIVGIFAKIMIICGFLIFTSWVTQKFEDLDNSKETEQKKLVNKNIYVISFLVGVILVIGIGNFLSALTVKTVGETEIGATIYKMLGSDGSENVGIGADNLNINSIKN